MMQSHLAAILQDLPGLPADVAEQWLAPHAARSGFGWPPPKEGRTEPWSLILMGRPLPWWRDRLWHQEPLPMTLAYMSNATQFQTKRLIKAVEDGRDPLPDSQRRIAAARAYIQAHGTWPRPPIAFPDADGLALADGHHRLAALVMEMADATPGMKERHEIWIALPKTEGDS